MRGMPSTLTAIALTAALAAGFGLGTRAAGIHPVRIVSGSMSPTIKPGDVIVVRDLDAGDRDRIDCGDVILFSFPLGTSGRAIKRVVAISGDIVEIHADSVGSTAGRSPSPGLRARALPAPG